MLPAAVAAFLALPSTALGGTGIAGAASTHAAAAFTCTGTQAAPGFVPTGVYSSLTVTGVCAVDDGVVLVTGNVLVETANGALGATSYYDEHTSPPSGRSGLIVDGNILVGTGATLVMGCGPVDNACKGDPNQHDPTLRSPGVVGGSVIATNALGVNVFDSIVAGDVRVTGGGGGRSAVPVPPATRPGSSPSSFLPPAPIWRRT